jgi:hypothetical protein
MALYLLLGMKKYICACNEQTLKPVDLVTPQNTAPLEGLTNMHLLKIFLPFYGPYPETHESSLYLYSLFL